MAGTDEAGDGRLRGRRVPRGARHGDGRDHDDDGGADDEIDAVTRLMGFLRAESD
ncbi:MAG TPA: hypothetical protein VGJ43_11710 [Acidimicrobiales bacterium]|jgi:hypothetical protein